MDELGTTIPASMRPSQSVVDHVKSTVNELISSALSKLASTTPKDAEESINSDDTKDVDSQDEDRKEEVVTATTHVHSQRTHKAFNARVKSFTLSLWCGKPLCLSPPLLARYGWKCVGEDIVKCCTCSAIQTLHLPWPNASNYHSSCQEAQRKILEGHLKICAWPSNPACQSFLNPFDAVFLSQKEKEDLKFEFSARAKRLHKLQENLPYISSETLQDLKLDDSDIPLLRKLWEVDYHNDDNLHEAMCLSATSLSLCGWDTSLERQLPSIHCSETGRSIGLWNFISVATNDDSSSSTPAKRRKTDDKPTSLTIEKSSFHPIEQHHVWSPWIVTFNPDLKDTDSPLVRNDVQPGWAVLRDLLIDSTSEVDRENNQPGSYNRSPSLPKKSGKTPPRVALQQAKRILDEWSTV